jgi:ABC-type multidrug transport system fused ATPase/permease subunit
MKKTGDSELGLFLKFLKPYKGKIYLILLSQLVIIGCSISVPYILGKIIHDLEIRHISVQSLILSLILLAAIYFIWDALQIFVDINFERVNKGVENDIRAFCYSNILNSPMAKFHKKSEGEIITRVIKDTEKIEKTFSSVFQLFDAITNTIAIIVMMIVVSRLLAIIIIALYVVIIFIHRIMAKPLKELYTKYKHSEEMLLIDLRNQLTGFLTTKIFSLEEKSIELLKKRNDENLKRHVKIGTRVSIVKNVNFFSSSIFRVLTVVIGGILYLYKLANIGQIFTLNTYAIQMTYELRTIIEIDIILRDIKTSFTRIIAFLNEFKMADDGKGTVIDRIERITFKNVSFEYEGKKLFNNLNFDFKKGTVVGIKGQNGSGKTTLTYLICGFYKPKGIFVNGISNQFISENEMMRHTSYVLQNVHLFPATVLDNLTCFKNMDIEKVYEVCKSIGLHEKIMRLPDGYMTMVNEKNMNLSGGEKQLIAVARALLKEADILILDEINSALDPETENELLKNIQTYFKNKIVFIISHREKIFNMCDQIINLSPNG